MSDPKLIFKERFSLDKDEKARLNYEDLFQVKSEEDVDYQEVIERNNLEWTKRLNETKQLAIKEGYDAGLSDGEAKAVERIDEQLHHFEEAIMELDRRLTQTIDEIKPGVSALVFDIAEKIIGVPITNKRLTKWVEEQIIQNLKTLTDNTKVEILVSEYDYESIKQVMDSIQTTHSIQVKYSNDLLSGEFKIDTPYASIINNFKKKMEDFRDSAPLADWGKRSKK